LWQEPQSDAARMFGCVGIKLTHCNVGTRVLVVEAGLLGDIVTGFSHRYIACFLMPFRGQLRAGNVFEELGHTLIDLGCLIGEYPQRCAAGDGVWRGTLNIVMIGKGGGAEFVITVANNSGS